METCCDARFNLATTLNFLFSPSTEAKLPPKAKKLQHKNNHLSLIWRSKHRISTQTGVILIISQNEHPLCSVSPQLRAFNRSLSDSPDCCAMHFQCRLLSVRRGDPTLTTRGLAASSVVNQSHTVRP